MTIKEKLEAMMAMTAKNRAADQEFTEAEKTLKEWKVSFAVITVDDIVIEDDFIGKAADIFEMAAVAKELLNEVSPSVAWKKWMIWDIGIMNEQLLF